MFNWLFKGGKSKVFCTDCYSIISKDDYQKHYDLEHRETYLSHIKTEKDEKIAVWCDNAWEKRDK